MWRALGTIWWSAVVLSTAVSGCGDDDSSSGDNASGAPAATGGRSESTGGRTETTGGRTETTGGRPEATGGRDDTGGRSSTGGRNQTDTGGRAETTGGRSATGGATEQPEGGMGGAPAPSGDCDDPNLVWKTANKTNYTSYPDPGSEECIEFNGCTWEGLFAACDDKKSEAWVSEHDIVAAFPDFEELELHDLCLRKGSKTIVVTVLDTCADGDCDGCCSENQGNADQLIDLESYTNERWGVADGAIEWADLGPTSGAGCD